LVLGNEKNQVTMQAIRYSKAFKMQCVREVEAGKSCAYAVQRKYKIKGTTTVMRWVRQLGSGRYGKIIRVEKAHEVNEAGQLRSELRRVKEALADTHMELALEQAFLVVACEELDQSLEEFKKKHAGGRRTRRSKPSRS
jgi:transposase-like protein